MVIVVGMIAAIPASTQILSGSSGESIVDNNLPMLILVNRLELSEEQMEALHNILTDLLEEKETVDGLQSEFEDVMIRFNGTREELDELLAAFREDQQALAEAMHESIEASLDEVRDLLSINQGIALREAFSEMLGRSVLLGSDRSVNHPQRAPGMMGNRMLAQLTGRSEIVVWQMQQEPRGGQMQTPMQSTATMGGRNGSFEQVPDRFGYDSTSSMMWKRFDNSTVPEMFGERFSQGIDDADIGAISEHLRDRIAQFEDKVPEGLRGQLAERFGVAVEDLTERLDRNFSGTLGQMDGRAGNVMPGQGSVGRFGGTSHPTQRLQSIHDEQFVERDNLFELLEQVADVLELKMEAMK